LFHCQWQARLTARDTDMLRLLVYILLSVTGPCAVSSSEKCCAAARPGLRPNPIGGNVLMDRGHKVGIVPWICFTVPQAASMRHCACDAHNFRESPSAIAHVLHEGCLLDKALVAVALAAVERL
jgi:hypothetical protein